MGIKGTWAEPCPGCGALDGCCQSSKDRRDTADSLGKLVDRQSQTITKLTRELQEARQVIADRRWNTIDTAPKDGREVLLMVKLRAGIQWKTLVGHFMPGGHCIEDHPPIDKGWYFWNGHMFDEAADPTHWMPLPQEIPK